MILQRCVILAFDLLVLYFVAILLGQIYLGLRSLAVINRSRQYKSIQESVRVNPDFMPSMSLVIPVYNQRANVVSFLNSAFQLDYPDYEIILVNDGSIDGTLEALIAQFDLTILQELTQQTLPAQAVRATYHSTAHRNLRVIDKEHGGRADALNVGINSSHGALLCVLDPRMVLEEGALKRTVQVFLDHPETVACSGLVLIDSGRGTGTDRSKIESLSVQLVSLFQVVQNFARDMIIGLGWSSLNAGFSIPRSFALYSKEAVVKVGGYSTETIAEDSELIVRLHREMRLSGTTYRIETLPMVVGWVSPETELAASRLHCIRLQQGLAESLALNRNLLFASKGGVPGWLRFPCAFAFEWIYPIMEIGGLSFVVFAYTLDAISASMVGLFLVVTIGFQIIISLMALLLDEVAFHARRKTGSVFVLIAFAVIGNLGYRQLSLVWRIVGLIKAVPVPSPAQIEATQTEAA